MAFLYFSGFQFAHPPRGFDQVNNNKFWPKEKFKSLEEGDEIGSRPSNKKALNSLAKSTTNYTLGDIFSNGGEIDEDDSDDGIVFNK